MDSHEGEADRTDDVTVLVATYQGVQTLIWSGTAPAGLSEIARLGDEMAAALGTEAALAGKVQVILDEIGSNLVNHAAGNSETAVELSVDLFDTGRGLSMVFSDNGPAFDPDNATVPDTTLALEDRAVGGLGLHMVRNLSESFTYSRRGDRNVYRVTLC